jgi:hypothetical protein
MTKGKTIAYLILCSVFFLLLGAYASEFVLHFIDRVLFVIGVFPWQYWLFNVIGLLILRLWWSDWWTHFYAAKIQPYQKRISQMMTGWGFWVVSNWWIDNPVYLLVIAHEGLVTGGIIMTAFTVFWNSAYVIFHEYHKRNGIDWLGLDGIDSMRQDLKERLLRSESSRSSLAMRILLFIPKGFIRMVLWMLEKGDGFAFVALTVWTDSFVTLAYVRRGRTGTITAKDWGLFVLSTIISNAYWSIRSYGIVVVILYFVHIFN